MHKVNMEVVEVFFPPNYGGFEKYWFKTRNLTYMCVGNPWSDMWFILFRFDVDGMKGEI